MIADAAPDVVSAVQALAKIAIVRTELRYAIMRLSMSKQFARRSGVSLVRVNKAPSRHVKTRVTASRETVPHLRHVEISGARSSRGQEV